MAKRHKKVLTRSEKLARDIARWEAKHNAAKDMLVRSTVELKKLYRQRQRAKTTAPVVEHIGNGVVAIPTEHFDKAVEVPAEALDAATKPERKRTPAPRGSVAFASLGKKGAFAHDLAIAARESAEDQGVIRQQERSAEAERSVEARDKRMRAAGFHKVSKRSK